MSDDIQRIYENQTVVIQATTGVDIENAVDLEIRYIKPDGTTGAWTATEVSAPEGIMQIDLDNDILDQIGIWIFWAYVEFADNRWIEGDIHKEKIYEAGKS